MNFAFLDIRTQFFMFALRFALPIRNSDPGSHNSRLFFPLFTTVRAFHFHGKETFSFSSLVDSLAETSKIHHGGIHNSEPTLLVAEVEGNHD